jgi:hypothetical protein
MFPRFRQVCFNTNTSCPVYLRQTTQIHATYVHCYRALHNFIFLCLCLHSAFLCFCVKEATVIHKTECLRAVADIAVKERISDVISANKRTSVIVLCNPLSPATHPNLSKKLLHTTNCCFTKKGYKNIY